jgi:hypothetical protein
MQKATLIVLIFATALLVWLPRQVRIENARNDVTALKLRQATLEEQIAAAEISLDSTRGALRSEHSTLGQTLAALSAAQFEIEKEDPEVRWVAPPVTWPDWNPESPYVWLRKEMLPRLHVPILSEQGELLDSAALVLCLEPAARSELNQQLKRLLAEQRAIELANAEVTDEHVPQIEQAEGRKLTVRAQPAFAGEGARLRMQFEETLLRYLGQQRSDLLVESAKWWLNEQFSGPNAATIISVARHPDGRYTIIKESNHGWSSASGMTSLDGFVPPHLLPLFEELGDTN